MNEQTPQQTQATVPWHQDAAYLSEECWTVHQATAWIPLLDATKQTGCMEVIPRGDHTGAVASHVAGMLYIEIDHQQ